MVSIYDSKAEAWSVPVFMRSAGEALRSFADAVNGSEGEFCKHPEDYTLFLIGDFDPQGGLVSVLEAPVSLCTGVSVVRGEVSQISLFPERKRGEA